MRYYYLISISLLLMLVGCGDQKSAEVSTNQGKGGVSAEKIYPADDPAAPHAKSDAEKQKALTEKAYPADDPAAPHAKTEAEKQMELSKEAYPADDPTVPHAK